MSANTKYTPAPQEDPDVANYAQPPPSYQAESSSAQDQQFLFGGPRSSEDNIPDDFKVRLVMNQPPWILWRSSCRPFPPSCN